MKKLNRFPTPKEEAELVAYSYKLKNILTAMNLNLITKEEALARYKKLNEGKKNGLPI